MQCIFLSRNNVITISFWHIQCFEWKRYFSTWSVMSTYSDWSRQQSLMALITDLVLLVALFALVVTSWTQRVWLVLLFTISWLWVDNTVRPFPKWAVFERLVFGQHVNIHRPPLTKHPLYKVVIFHTFESLTLICPTWWCLKALLSCWIHIWGWQFTRSDYLWRKHWLHQSKLRINGDVNGHGPVITQYVNVTVLEEEQQHLDSDKHNKHS